jgi:hypothetical protein
MTRGKQVELSPVVSDACDSDSDYAPSATADGDERDEAFPSTITTQPVIPSPSTPNPTVRTTTTIKKTESKTQNKDQKQEQAVETVDVDKVSKKRKKDTRKYDTKSSTKQKVDKKELESKSQSKSTKRTKLSKQYNVQKSAKNVEVGKAEDKAEDTINDAKVDEPEDAYSASKIVTKEERESILRELKSRLVWSRLNELRDLRHQMQSMRSHLQDVCDSVDRDIAATHFILNEYMKDIPQVRYQSKFSTFFSDLIAYFSA